MLTKIAKVLLVAVGIIAILFFAGPRVPIDETIRPVRLPADLDAYLAQSESQFNDIVPGAEKTIQWAFPDKRKTALAIIYFHGYSATRQETSPLSEDMASQLNANLYLTRLTGHGRSGDAMAEASVNDWLNDAQEALAIGQQIGEKVIVIGVSTGGTLASWLAAQPETNALAAAILISPNFAPRDSNSEILLLPWGGTIAGLLIGDQRSWQPANEMQAEFWTESYPTTALLPMMGLVELTRSQDLAQIDIPILTIYSPNDEVVNAGKIEEAHQAFGSSRKAIIPIESVGDPSNHVLAGDILSPDDTQQLLEMILRFVEELPA